MYFQDMSTVEDDARIFLKSAIIFGLLGIYLGSSVQAKHLGIWFGGRKLLCTKFPTGLIYFQLSSHFSFTAL